MNAIQGSNSMVPTDREIIFKRTLADLDDIDNRLREIQEERKTRRRQAKADGFDMRDEIDLGLRIRRAEKPETVSTSIQRMLQTAAYLALPVNFQMSLFDASAAPDARSKAFAAGREAGIEGRDAKPPADLTGDLATEWMAGWHNGQEHLAEAMAKRMEAQNAEAPATEPKRRGRPPKAKPEPVAEIKTAAELGRDGADATGETDPFPKDDDDRDLRPAHLRNDAGRTAH